MSDIRFMQTNIKILTFGGLWEPGNMNNSIIKFVFDTLRKGVYFFFVAFNISQFLEMYNIGSNILLLMGNAAVSLMYFVTVLKVYTLFYRKNSVCNLFEQIRKLEYDVGLKSPQEKKLYEESISQNAFITSWFTRLGFSTLAMFLIARPAEFYIMGPQEIHGYKMPMLLRCVYLLYSKKRIFFFNSCFSYRIAR